MSRTGRATVRDIARHAAVSVATVSRVANNDPQVSAGTRERVLASMSALDYRPSALGLGLAEQRFHALGVVLPGLGGPYFAELIQGAESSAVDARVAVHVLGTHLRPDAAADVRHLAERTDGLVVVGGTVPDELVGELAAQLPLVLVAARVEGVVSVRVDSFTAARELTAHLLDVHGYRRLRFIGSPEGSPDTTARHEGFLLALAERGCAPVGEPLRHGLEATYGAIAARELLAAGDLPDALVCANDELAIGVLATLPGLGCRIPGDVAIVGFDDAALASLASPTLTTVHQPVFELGARAAGLVLSAVAPARQRPGRLAPSDLVLPTRTVIRESCGCTH